MPVPNAVIVVPVVTLGVVPVLLSVSPTLSVPVIAVTVSLVLAPVMVALLLTDCETLTV